MHNEMDNLNYIPFLFFFQLFLRVCTYKPTNIIIVTNNPVSSCHINLLEKGSNDTIITISITQILGLNSFISDRDEVKRLALLIEVIIVHHFNVAI